MGIGRNSLNVYLSFRQVPSESIFSFTGWRTLYYIWLWVEGMGSSCPRYFPSSPGDFSGSFNISYHFNYCSANPGFGASPGVWREIRPICSRRPLFQNWFSYSLFPLTERRCHFRFMVLANHLASLFFLPLSGDSLGLLSLLSNICWLSLWPTFFTFSDRPWGIDLYYYFSF